MDHKDLRYPLFKETDSANKYYRYWATFPEIIIRCEQILQILSYISW